ncbi:DUF2975 domain-containing protein [Gracilimonas sp. BCB1]|uniref:DUF2975 domain-containing protein n=1 Tax=Gracilimonas sp. BCB1 TaxID=3152362 RepID=UPI0032D8C668
MKLRKDWSLAHFLYYTCWIGYWSIGLYLVISIASTIMVSSDGYTRLFNLPVLMEVEQFSGYEELEMPTASINIPEQFPVEIDIKSQTDIHGFEIMLLFLIQSLSSFALIAVLFLLSSIFKNVAEEDPFNQANPKNLFYCGVITFITGCINIVLFFTPIPLLQGLNLPVGYQIQHLSSPTDILLLIGITFIVLAYVFKEGARMYEEQKLTV